MLHHLASRQLAVEMSILKYLNLVSDCSGLCIVSILFCSGSACVLGSFKRPCSLSLAAQHVLLHAVTKENKQPVMWSSAEEFFPCSPPFPPLDYIWYASSRSTSRTCIPKKLWWHTPAPSFFGLLPVVMVTPGSEMAFHSGESSPPPHSLLPSSDQKPHFRQPKILYLPHTALFRRACWSARLLSLTRLVRCCCLTEASAVPGNVWVISSNVTLLYRPLSSALEKKKLESVISSRQLYVPPPSWNPSYPSVNQGGSSRVKKKMPGICNPRTLGLKLCSFFFLGLAFTAQRL